MCCVCLNLHHHHRVPPSDNNFLFLLHSLFYLFATRRFSSDFAFHIIRRTNGWWINIKSICAAFVVLRRRCAVGWGERDAEQSSDSAFWDWDERNIKKCKMKKRTFSTTHKGSAWWWLFISTLRFGDYTRCFSFFFFSFSSLLTFLGLPTIDVDNHSLAPRLDRDRERARYVKSKESGSSQRRRGEWKWRRNGEQKL